MSRTLEQARDTELDVESIRGEFPSLHQTVRGKPLVYLDNAAPASDRRWSPTPWRATTRSTPRTSTAACTRSPRRATLAYENAREQVQRFVNAADSREIVFTRGTTEADQPGGASFAQPRLKPGDEILVSAMEHHSNIVPWQLVCEATGATLVVAPMNDRGEIQMDELESACRRRRAWSVVWISNALGTVNPSRRSSASPTTAACRCWSTPRRRCRTAWSTCRPWAADFLAFSGHKAYAPGGIGVLYGRLDLLESMPPWQGGGDMILSVSFAGSTYNHPPHRFEAGTPNVEGTIGLGAALTWLRGLGLEKVERHEQQVLDLAVARLREISGVRLVATRAGAPARSRSPSTAPTLTTSARCSTARASRCVPATTARSR
jgi:cysteine desulfurase/selenocysteine lyase